MKMKVMSVIQMEMYNVCHGKHAFYKVKIYDSIYIMYLILKSLPQTIYWIIWICSHGMSILSYLPFVCASRVFPSGDLWRQQHFDIFEIG